MNPRQEPPRRTLTSRWIALTQPLLDRMLLHWTKAPEYAVDDWGMDVHAARLAQEPLRARRLLHAVVALIVLLLVWAYVAKIDEVTRGQAKVVPSRQLQVIQSLDGGIVSQILVREGQIVNMGERLIGIDATRFQSSFRENRAQYLALLAKTRRLASIAEKKPFELPPELHSEAPDLVAAETRLYITSREELDSQIAIAKQQLEQRQQELHEATAHQLQASRGYQLSSQELAATEPLVESGAVSEVEVLRLRRDVARLRGERDQASAQVTRVRAGIQEAMSKVEQVEMEFLNRVRNELADATATLNSLAAGSEGLSDKVKQTEVRSPVRGTVKRLLVNTVGGVVLPGRDIVEIVPLDDTLLLEAKIAPRDIAFLRPNQPATVKFTAYDFVIYGGMDAEVESIGADTITDDDGNSFYLIRVRTKQSTLGNDLPIIPGMVAEVDILTGRKSVLSYLLKPVLRAKQYALTER
jgi:membrane fusion protein, adhesin transport system